MQLLSAIKVVSPLIAASVIWFLLRDLPTEQRTVGAIFAFTVGLWMTELLPLAVTALLSSVLLIVVTESKEKAVFAAYGDPTIPLFIGSFILAKAMEVSKLGDRFAYLILSRKWATRSPSALLLTLGAISCVFSLFVSNTAITAMMLPIGLSMLAVIGTKEQTATYGIGLMLMLTWGSSIAVGVPVGTPPNLIAINLISETTGRRIGFLDWMAFGMPITIVMLFACWAVLRFLYRKDPPDTKPATERSAISLRDMGAFTHAQRNTFFAFLLALTLWILPDTLVAILGDTNPMAAWSVQHIPASIAAILGATLLFLLPVRDSEERFTWKNATTIDWGTILLFAGGIALGQAMFQSGLAKSLGEFAATASGAQTVWAITALCTATAIILSELASNTASATTLVPVAIGLAEGAGVSPFAPAIGVAIGASLGFMLPVSTAPNAIVYSSGFVPAREMMKAGIIIDVVGFIVTMAGLMLVLPMLGLA